MKIEGALGIVVIIEILSKVMTLWILYWTENRVPVDFQFGHCHFTLLGFKSDQISSLR